MNECFARYSHSTSMSIEDQSGRSDGPSEHHGHLATTKVDPKICGSLMQRRCGMLFLSAAAVGAKEVDRASGSTFDKVLYCSATVRQ